ncbi:MAG: ATP-dependent ligase [Devosia sp.]|uniref:DNA ligase D n=1 Tax=Devosia sp. TaxID=1871048 RepID=UPI002635C63B|nr:DNA ligase D [Devosia sp.]MDB5538342.1 ATP-dependent ligase [Devosia sp.]
MALSPSELLKDYRAKRDFAKTAEPSGAEAKAGKGQQLHFVVQKHDATRLHYDFRLELDGVLKSWAVTKGPSTNPADKRLAVRVEDHPLHYGDFEGTIPEGEYGGGTVMLWDEGTWEPIGDPHEGLEEGDLKFRLNGKRMKGEWVLVHMKGRDSKTRNGSRENWLLIKHRDDYASETDGLTEKFDTSVETGRNLAGIAKGDKPRKRAAKAEAGTESNTKVWTGGKAVALPDFREPQLATLVEEIPAGEDWLFEMKYDGYRCLAAIAGPEVRLFTRNGNDWTEQFHRMVEPLSKLTKGSVLLDGEICSFKDGRTDFSTLKDALSTGGPLVYFVFDLLELDGESLEHLPLLERKERLRKLLGKTRDDAVVQYSEHVRGHGEEVLKAMCAAHQEGVIAKRADAPYRHERTKTWLKIKCSNRQEFVIGGWRPSDKKKTFASLLLGTWEDDKLVYRGRVGTGFTETSAAELQAEMDKRARKTPAFETVPRDIARQARWIEPELVGEVDFTEFTPDGVLRHPSFVGLRKDKEAREVKLETKGPEPAATKPKSRAKLKTMKLTDEMGIAAAERLGVRLTHPERVVFEEQDVTKAEIAAYYEAVADRMLRHVANRPLSLVRCPQGPTKHCFFQKHDSGGFPDDFKKVPIEEKDGKTDQYLYVEDLAGIVAGVQMNTLEFHIWGSHVDDLEKPDRIIFDIDPDEGLDFKIVRQAALEIRDILGEWGLESFPMVTGGKGVHVIAPLKPVTEWPMVKLFCRTFAQRLEENAPGRFTSNIRKVERKGRMFVDYLRNERGATAIAPFSTRSRPGAPCAVPIGWDEVETITAANQFSLKAAAARAHGPDPWPDYFTLTQSITRGMVESVAGPLKDLKL